MKKVKLIQMGMYTMTKYEPVIYGRQHRDFVNGIVKQIVKSPAVNNPQDLIVNELIGKLQDVHREYPDLLQSGMLDFFDVFLHGARKHGTNNYMTAEGTKCSRNDNSASMLRHLAEFSANKQADRDSGLHPTLHLACRAMIGYIRDVNKLKHSRDY